ncbi:GNAT family N-acetyltransferase [Mesorhizobium sp. LHD-90]|uniref:GNAT family N-acetyltransferase n=1 Tax=Mesorhizobium sp. LHD-90 TaxID=3071414 RepID=UPI0027DFF7D9|nr:GNAT family N-acetyltransferase [Mesorhizobium sp. LHD-90]MDQ6436532.1 GNAT family N-acetyltransferase [Mesorhizobium sp. LHD-90]
MPASTIIEIPSIETERTILRAHRPGDFDAYAAMWARQEVTRFIGGFARSRDESWIRFLRHAGTWAMLGYGFWAVEDKRSGRFIGEAGYHQIYRDMTPSIDGFPECGWALIPEMHGKGLATEIVTAVVAWGDQKLGGQRQVCIIDRDNHASICVAGKCGFGNPVEALFGEETVFLFERRPAAV